MLLAMGVPAANNIAVEISDLGKRFGSHWVLAHLNLTIRRGESVALLGRNGSGKSTLLRIMASLVAPTTGSLKILGHNPHHHKMLIRKKLRLLGHEKQLYGMLTVLENLRLATAIRGFAAHTGDSEINKLLELFHLSKFQDRRVNQLSEGMRKRVVLTKLLLSSSDLELILLDEPFPTLDMESRKILDHLIQSWRDQRKTILLTSHDHAQVLTQVDRLLILQEGQICYDGPPKPLEQLL